MIHSCIEKLSNYPRFFLFCRGLLEANFTAVRGVIKEFLPVPPNRNILEIACGPGAFSDLFSAQSYSGVDINEHYIRYAERNYAGSFKKMDARRLEFDDASFDNVLVFGLIHHLDDEDALATLQNLSRVLKPQGRAVLIEDIPTVSRLNIIGRMIHWAENGHFIRPQADYQRLLERYFQIDQERVFRSGICDYYSAVLSPAPSERVELRRQTVS